MWNAVIVDRDYGSVSLEKQKYIKEQYAQNRINLRLEHYPTPDEIIANCKDADAILGTGNPPITRDVLEGLPNLKVVQRFGIGVNSVDLEAATREGVLVTFMPGFCIQELALHATALILDLLRNISYYDRGIRKGEWRKAKGHMPRNPKDLTLGLYGFGGSARPLYNTFYHGFGTKVVTCDPYIDKNIRENYDVEIVSFEELLKQSDIVSIHAPLTEETHHIFNYEAFKKMKSDAMIVNISRGGLIDQEGLVRALNEGEIRFAGLDVFEQEPLNSDSALVSNEQTVLTCHSAFYGEQAQKNQIQLAIELVNDILNRKTVKRMYIANKEVKSKIDSLTIQV
ncbi:D-3-phosphoglycerate dehydrogenase [Anaerovirgula multivorans]|uniref:D-3-phosphoglycerate dehydrogenase n=1 Tax=Anaerovirgula multivorans TaxID=312168 RepID=A0A239L6F1_9FIRM|nr:C-terminal binding protein [Anaerovirgula multivorans]SNT26167.1 D-3-phosphoglycerate dehydrogenase [Anaerovirgula multivorans]